MLTLGTVKFLQVLLCSLEARHTRRKARSQLRDVIWDFLQKSIDFISLPFSKIIVAKKACGWGIMSFWSFQSNPDFRKHVATPAEYEDNIPDSKHWSAWGPRRGVLRGVQAVLSQFSLSFQTLVGFPESWLFFRCQFAKSTMSKAPPG